MGRLPNFQKEVLDYKPDVVTLEFVNDMGIPVERLRQLYAEILRQTRAAGAVREATGLPVLTTVDSAVAELRARLG